VRKIKGGPGKYKGKLPFKCFNCDRKIHFVTMCPYVEMEYGDDEEYFISITMETNPIHE